MGFDSQHRLPWSELRRRMTTAAPTALPTAAPTALPAPVPVEAPPAPPAGLPWAELHVHSAFSFLDGASEPEDLVAEALRLGVETLAVTDHDGLYGAVRLGLAAKGTGLRTVFGAELNLRDSHGSGLPDEHLLVLARSPRATAGSPPSLPPPS